MVVIAQQSNKKHYIYFFTYFTFVTLEIIPIYNYILLNIVQHNSFNYNVKLYMIIISLGGIGGCDLATALRKLNQLTHPYDWLITTQSFIISSFNNFDLFFEFNTNYLYDTTKLITKNKQAIMLHDFKNFVLEREKVVEKYKRRFHRLNTNLNSNEDILFVRIYDNLEEELIPKNYYDNILIREKEDLKKWEQFILFLQNKYLHKSIKLLIITNYKDICDMKFNNINIYFTEKHKQPEEIKKIIQETVLNTVNN